MPESSEHSPKLKSVLVTGASGLIGTDLLDSIKSTHEVRTYGRKLIAGFKGIKGELSEVERLKYLSLEGSLGNQRRCSPVTVALGEVLVGVNPSAASGTRKVHVAPQKNTDLRGD